MPAGETRKVDTDFIQFRTSWKWFAARIDDIRDKSSVINIGQSSAISTGILLEILKELQYFNDTHRN